jgi:hypothetical protein
MRVRDDVRDLQARSLARQPRLEESPDRQRRLSQRGSKGDSAYDETADITIPSRGENK